MFCAVRQHRPTRVLSPTQLPTDHDYAVSTADIRVISRRFSRIACFLLCGSRSFILSRPG